MGKEKWEQWADVANDIDKIVDHIMADLLPKKPTKLEQSIMENAQRAQFYALLRGMQLKGMGPRVHQ